MRVIVLGAGLAGLSSAHELAKNGVDVTVLEKGAIVGGIAKSFSKDGFTYDLGPHRFHSRDEGLMEHLKSLLDGNVLMKHRKSRIFLMDRFFDYPLKLGNALSTMPPSVTMRILFDYLSVKASNVVDPSPDDSFESWVTNRFGGTLYRIFFGEYTEKTWGLPCDQISADWASQRISLLSLWDTLVKSLISSGETPRTYVSNFIYPESGGIGRICETYASNTVGMGGRVLLDSPATKIHLEDGRVVGVSYPGCRKPVGCDHLFSTVALTDIVRLLHPAPSDHIFEHADKLRFRSIMFVQLMLGRDSLSADHWIYLPEKHILGNRITEYKNFSVNNAPSGKTVIGVEITCDFGDKIWNKSEAELTQQVITDLHEIGLIMQEDVLDSTVKRVKHAYPIYDLEYKDHMNPIKKYLDSIPNLTYFGRNALFRYNNMDHSVDMGLKAAKNLLGEKVDYKHPASGNHWFG